MREHIDEFIRLHPRTECQETPIHQPKRERSEWGYINTTIEVDETRQS